MTVYVCSILDKLPKKDKQEASVVTDARMIAQRMFGRTHRAKKNSRLEEAMVALKKHCVFTNDRC